MHGFEKLTCNWLGANKDERCNSQDFVPMFHLIWKDGGGMTTEPAGYTCAKCGTLMDGAAGIAAVKKKHNLEKIRELEAEGA
jgi:hypothetical protein